MKNIPIKFKGESVIGTIYGYFVTRDGKAYIANDYGSLVSVDANTVEQLIGYDVNGNEVYEERIIADD